MNKKYIIGILAGFLLVILAMPLGELYGKAYITIGNGMAVDQYTMLMERARKIGSEVYHIFLDNNACNVHVNRKGTAGVIIDTSYC